MRVVAGAMLLALAATPALARDSLGVFEDWAAFRDPASYFHRYVAMTDAEAIAFAEHVWVTINAVNLRDNIAPTRDRAKLVLEKGPDHRIASVALRV